MRDACRVRFVAEELVVPSRFFAEANVDFADDVRPFLRRAKTPDELLEG